MPSGYSNAMILTCPSCDAQYILPDDAIGPKGRRVKCTSCAYTWLQRPEEPDHQDDPALDALSRHLAQTTSVSDFDTTRARQVMTPVAAKESVAASVMTGIGLGLILFVVTTIFLIVLRASLVPLWPPLNGFYNAIGLKVAAPGEGLAVENLTSELTDDGKLQVKGQITNVVEDEQRLPSLLIRVNGEKGWLKDWPITLPSAPLKAGKSVGFDYTLDGVPAGVTDVTIRFSE